MTVQFAVLPLIVFAVIFAVPTAIAVTFPCFGVTVAMDVSLEVNSTDLSSAFSGKTVGTKVAVFPTFNASVVLSNATLSGGITPPMQDLKRLFLVFRLLPLLTHVTLSMFLYFLQL